MLTMGLGTFACAVLALVLCVVDAGPVQSRQAPSPIKNGDFENGSVQPWMIWGGVKANPKNPKHTIVSPGSNSSKAVELKMWVEGWIGLMERPLQQGTNYSISVDYKIVDAPDGCLFMLGADDNDIDRYYWNTTATAGSDWATAHLIYPNFAKRVFGMRIGVQCRRNSDVATFQIDNIKMEAIGSTVPSSCPGNAQLGNGDFETGSFAPWYAPEPFEGNGQGRIGKWASPGHNSAHALEVDFAEGIDIAAWNFRQTVTNVCFTHMYRYGFAANWLNYTGPTTGPGACTLSVAAYDCDSNDTPHISSPKAGWTQFAFTCQAKRDIIDLAVVIECDGKPSGPFGIQLDSFKIQHIAAGPSPTPTPKPTGTPSPTPTPVPGRRRRGIQA